MIPPFKTFTIVLKYRNCYTIEKDWQYTDYAPMYYYWYLKFKAFRYKLVYKTDRLAMYERI